MTRDRAKLLHDRIVQALASRGIAVDARATPADLARQAAAAGELRVGAFIDGCYYPVIYGDGNATLADGDAEDLVRAIEGSAVAGTASQAAAAARPAAPVPAPTAAPSPAGAPLERDWTSTLGFLVMALLLTCLSIALVVTGESKVGAVVAGLLALTAFMAARSSRRGHCPTCRSRVDVSVDGDGRGIAPCHTCADYLRVENARLVPVPAGFVADTESFQVRWEKAPPVAEWIWPWRDRCGVCGAPATTTVGMVWNPNDKYALPGGTRVAIPGCDKHQVSVRVMYPFVSFRSYDHWRAFRTANGIGPVPPAPGSGHA